MLIQFRFLKIGIISVYILFAVMLIGCNNSSSDAIDESEESDIIQAEETVSTSLLIVEEPGICVVSYNQSAKLNCKAESDDSVIIYQWYECSDISGNNAEQIQGATLQTFQTPAFNQTGIRYYYCLVKDSVEEKKSAVTVVAYTGLPIVKIETADGENPSTAKEKHNGRMYLIKNGETIYDSGDKNEFSINVRGNATAYYPKHPYKLKLPKKANLLSDNPLNASENKDKNWVLLAGYCDKTLLRNNIGLFMASLFNEIEGNENLYIPNSQFVDVVINGQYIGNYCLTDSIKEGNDRVSISEGGVIAEYDWNYYSKEPKYIISDVQKYPYTFKYPDAEDNDISVYSAISNFGYRINSFETALYDSETDDWKNYVDIEAFARWFVVNNILANKDPNFYFYRVSNDNASKFIMGPVWDFEWSIGIGWYDDPPPYPPADYWVVNNWYFTELLNKPEFVEAVKNQWAAIKSYYPNLSETLNTKMDEYAEYIELSRKLNFFVWDILDKKISLGRVAQGSYEEELFIDKHFMVEHLAWLDSAINGL